MVSESLPFYRFAIHRASIGKRAFSKRLAFLSGHADLSNVIATKYLRSYCPNMYTVQHSCAISKDLIAIQLGTLES